MVLPDTAGTDRELTLAIWQPGDVVDMLAAMAASLEHLSPWMAFANDPLPGTEAQLGRFDAWEARRRSGGDAVYGIFLDGRAAGGCGLHWRLGADALEIGYWVHVEHTRRGVASRAAALLTDTAFREKGITHVEIHHDAANLASEGVPRRLGFTLVGESAETPVAPAESGVERRWRMTRENRRARRGALERVADLRCGR